MTKFWEKLIEVMSQQEHMQNLFWRNVSTELAIWEKVREKWTDLSSAEGHMKNTRLQAPDARRGEKVGDIDGSDSVRIPD